MSFITKKEGRMFEPGYFLINDENCIRETREIPTSLATNGIVPMGTIFPANDATAEGIVYEDVNVTSGNMPGSVVTKGDVVLDKLPVSLEDTAASALSVKGFTFR